MRISNTAAYRGQYLRPFVVIFGTLHTYHQIRMGLRRRRLVSWYYGAVFCGASGCNHRYLAGNIEYMVLFGYFAGRGVLCDNGYYGKNRRFLS